MANSLELNVTVLILILLEDTLWALCRISGCSRTRVLILILLEDTLWDSEIDFVDKEGNDVLILILLEDTLWGKRNGTCPLDKRRVLILILLEDTLWEVGDYRWLFANLCLNPYSIGRYSLRGIDFNTRYIRPDGLNPYSIGRYSLRLKTLWLQKQQKVLILILLEDTLWDYINFTILIKFFIVLILILLEDTLWVLILTLLAARLLQS